MALKSKYITDEEFKEYSGIDLSIELRDDDNSSNKVDAFLYRTERRLNTYLNATYQQDIDRRFPTFTDHQKLCYKHALMEQIIYVLQNNEISEDSGYDQERGVVASRNTLKSLSLAPNAYNELYNAGLINAQVFKRKGGWSTDYDF